MRTLTGNAKFGKVGVAVETFDVARERVDGMNIVFNDTPGFQLAADVVSALPPDLTIQDVLAAYDSNWKQDVNYATDRNALHACVYESDVILHAVNITENVSDDYKAEFKILQLCGKPVIPLLNFVRAQPDRRAEWVDYFKESGFHNYTEYDAHHWTQKHEDTLWRTKVPSVIHDQGMLDIVEAYCEMRRLKAEHQDTDAAGIISRLILELAKYQEPGQVSADGNDKEAIEKVTLAKFAKEIQKQEQNAWEKLLNNYDMEKIKVVDWLAAAILDDPESHSAGRPPEWFGENVIRHAATAATIVAFIGAAVDVATLGASLGTGTLVGGLIGAAIGGVGGGLYNYQFDQKRMVVTVKSTEELLNRVLGRSLCLVRDLRGRGGAIRGADYAHGGAAPNLRDSKRHLPDACNLGQYIDASQGNSNKTVYDIALGVFTWKQRPGSSVADAYLQRLDELRPRVKEWIQKVPASNSVKSGGPTPQVSVASPQS